MGRIWGGDASPLALPPPSPSAGQPVPVPPQPPRSIPAVPLASSASPPPFTFLIRLGVLGRVHLRVALNVVRAGEGRFGRGRLGQLLPQVGQRGRLGAERLLLEGGQHAGGRRQLHGGQAALVLLQVQNILDRERGRRHRARKHGRGERGSGRSPGSWKRRRGAAEVERRWSSPRGHIASPPAASPCALQAGRSGP